MGEPRRWSERAFSIKQRNAKWLSVDETLKLVRSYITGQIWQRLNDTWALLPC